MKVRKLFGVLVALVGVTAVALAATNLAGAHARPTCFGKPATKVGTARDDTINGTRRADVIVGMGGADTIDGKGGPDLICGDGGDGDTDPTGGDDRLIGGAANDKLDGQGGFDTLKGEGADDKLSAGFDAPGVADQAAATDFNKLFGGDGQDKVLGDRGNDVLFGDAGPDVIKGDKAGDRIDGGGGPDTVDGDSESATGAGDDFIDAGPGRDTVLAGDKNDVILGGDESGPGDKRLDGGDGNDQIRGDKGDDNLLGGPGGDDLDGGPGKDTCNPGDEPNDAVPKNCEDGPPDACSDSKHSYTVTVDLPSATFLPTADPATVEVCRAEVVKYVNDSQASLAVRQVSGPDNFQFPFGMAPVTCQQDEGPVCNQVRIIFGDVGTVRYQVDRGSPDTAGPVAQVIVRRP